jgi:uncharacterized RDD family membrane protein YckC
MSLEAPVQPLVACSLCGRVLAHSDVVQIAGNWLCADCKPVFLSRLMANGATAASPLAPRYGGFWIRFGARMIDGLIFAVPAMVLGALLIPNMIRVSAQGPTPPDRAFLLGIMSFSLVFLLVGACYEILMLRYRGATVGKIACGLKVVRSDGHSLGWGVCVGRFFMWNVVTSGIPYLNSVLMVVTAIMIGVDDEKRALHDRVCDTRVVYKPGVA